MFKRGVTQKNILNAKAKFHPSHPNFGIINPCTLCALHQSRYNDMPISGCYHYAPITKNSYFVWR